MLPPEMKRICSYWCRTQTDAMSAAGSVKSRQRINSRLRADANLATLSWRPEMTLISIHAGCSLLKSEGPFYQWIRCNVCVIYMWVHILGLSSCVDARWLISWNECIHLVNAINTCNLLQLISSKAQRENKNNQNRKPLAHLMGSR